MLRIKDCRQKVMHFTTLGALRCGECFEWIHEEDGLDYVVPHRVLHRNSSYLCAKSQKSRVFVINLLSGKIHHRAVDTPARRIDIEISIHKHGVLPRR